MGLVQGALYVKYLHCTWKGIQTLFLASLEPTLLKQPPHITSQFLDFIAVAGKNSPRRSPRNRRQKRNTGSDE